VRAVGREHRRTGEHECNVPCAGAGALDGKKETLIAQERDNDAREARRKAMDAVPAAQLVFGDAWHGKRTGIGSITHLRSSVLPDQC